MSNLPRRPEPAKTRPLHVPNTSETLPAADASERTRRRLNFDFFGRKNKSRAEKSQDFRRQDSQQSPRHNPNGVGHPAQSTTGATQRQRNGHVFDQANTVVPGERPAFIKLKYTNGKGIGTIAVTKIYGGQRILSEEPLFIVEHALHMEWRWVDWNTWYRDQVRIIGNRMSLFDGLYNAFPDYGEHFGRIYTNSIPLGAAAENPDTGLFLSIARINHSCRPNVHVVWNERRGEITAHAIRDIPAGAELTMSYVRDSFDFRQIRRERLKKDARFFCNCEECDGSQAEQELSDERIITTGAFFDQAVATLNGRPSPNGIYYTELECLVSMNYARDILENMQWTSTPLIMVYELCIKLAHKDKDKARTSAFARILSRLYLRLEGADSSNYIRARAISEHPGRHFNFGFYNIFRRSSPPEHMNDDEFNRWLWRRGPR